MASFLALGSAQKGSDVVKRDVKEFWEDATRAEGYARRTYLKATEKSIISRFEDQWPNWTLLDIGVGAGRTTVHFAPLVKSYVGVDFSNAMIKKCIDKYSKYRFYVQDVRNLNHIDSSSIDFVLFSYNGLGELGHDDAQAALNEIARVLRKSGYLFFSRHNILGAHKLFRIQFSRNPIRMYKTARIAMKLRSLNPEWRKLSTRDYAELHDYPYDFSKSVHYVSPSEQIRQLQRAGFENTRVILHSSAIECLENDTEIREESFLHFLTQKS